MISFPFAISPQNDDEKFMLEALKQAWKAYQNGEVPVGAVLVHQGRVIAKGYNQVEVLRDATAHAEMICITAGESVMENWRLGETSLYCTIEPCSMCAGAMLLSRVPTLIWGAPDLRHGANGSWVDLLSKPHPTHTVEIRKGVLENPCRDLMRNFFQEQRKRKVKRKRKVNGEPRNEG